MTNHWWKLWVILTQGDLSSIRRDARALARRQLHAEISAQLPDDPEPSTVSLITCTGRSTGSFSFEYTSSPPDVVSSRGSFPHPISQDGTSSPNTGYFPISCTFSPPVPAAALFLTLSDPLDIDSSSNTSTTTPNPMDAGADSEESGDDASEAPVVHLAPEVFYDRRSRLCF